MKVKANKFARLCHSHARFDLCAGDRIFVVSIKGDTATLLLSPLSGATFELPVNELY